MKIVHACAWLILTASLSGCGAFPSVGPTADVIDPGYDQRKLVDYEVFDIDPAVLGALQRYRPVGLYGRFGSRSSAPSQEIGVGDQVVVNLFEASTGGLFSGPATPGSSTSKTLTLPPQTVDRDGTISVPYAGRIRAAGRTPNQISNAIVEALKSKAIEPQAIVSIVQSGASQATVLGDATTGARVPLNIKGDRLLEVIAQSGGIKTLPHETFVRLTRGGSTAVASLRSIISNPEENVYIRPGDTIYVYRNTPKFSVIGAVTTQKDYQIDQDQLTLAEAVARSGGLNDLQADSSAVFLFRYENPNVVRAINPQSKFLNGEAQIPVVYRLSFKRPDDYFFAQKLLVQDNDLLYVANAPAVELTKFVTLARAIVATAATAAGKTTVSN